MRWVLLSYRLPREPSTPRIAVWRKVRRLGAVQLLDGLVALPLNARNREHLEWLADEALEAGGEAGVWLAEPDAATQRSLETRMAADVAQDYRAIIAAALEARGEPATRRRRTLDRLRRELHRVQARDHFPPGEADDARQAVEALAIDSEVSA